LRDRGLPDYRYLHEAPLMKLLWVEDSEDDVFLFTRAMYRSRQMVGVYHVWNGSEAIDYLMGNSPYDNRAEYPLPDVVVTDIKMPVLDGMNFVRWLRNQDQFKHLPVLFLSSSNLPADALCAASLGATGYVMKPVREPAREDFYASVMTKCYTCVPEFRALPR
jgi:CheY-like chemotaxis protein